MRTHLGVAYAVLAGVAYTRVRGATTRASHDARLEAELRDTILELRRSRARVAQAADTERRRIERDLHDGAQQRLIALRVKLSLAEELMGNKNQPVGDLIQEIAADAETALEELHALVHGIYPALLADRGLHDALKAIARSAPLPTRLLGHELGRYAAGVEAAVYVGLALADEVDRLLARAGLARPDEPGGRVDHAPRLPGTAADRQRRAPKPARLRRRWATSV